MQVDEFISKFEDWCDKTQNYDISIGKDFSINTKLVIDNDGFVWFKVPKSYKRIKSTVNVNNVEEFRYEEYSSEDSFLIICSDYSTGFFISENEIYYCINGEPSGWGTAAEHFLKYPNGDMNE